MITPFRDRPFRSVLHGTTIGTLDNITLPNLGLSTTMALALAVIDSNCLRLAKSDDEWVTAALMRDGPERPIPGDV